MGELMQLDFPVIDAHVHLYPDALAVKVVPSLGAKFGNPPAFDGTVAGCCANHATAGILASLNLPVATDAHQVAHTNDFWSAFTPSHTTTQGIFSLAAFHPCVPEKGIALEQIARTGFTGVKFHPEYQNVYLNDPGMDEVWAAMSDFDLVAYLHAGGERVFQAPYHSSPSEIRRLHQRFPKLKIAAAHLGGFAMWDEAEEVLMGQDVYLDLSHTFFWMDAAQILRLIQKHGAHRILFGTDAPWQTPREVLAAFLALPLTATEQKAICYTNTKELFKLEGV